jgi:hypothetical protein
MEQKKRRRRSGIKAEDMIKIMKKNFTFRSEDED